MYSVKISNKLRLELSPVASNMNLISGSTQGSNEDEESLQKMIGMQTRTDQAITEASFTNVANPKEASGNVQVEAAARHGVNDVFWEQFLTESPCCSDNEEALSN